MKRPEDRARAEGAIQRFFILPPSNKKAKNQTGQRDFEKSAADDAPPVAATAAAEIANVEGPPPAAAVAEIAASPPSPMKWPENHARAEGIIQRFLTLSLFKKKAKNQTGLRDFEKIPHDANVKGSPPPAAVAKIAAPSPSSPIKCRGIIQRYLTHSLSKKKAKNQTGLKNFEKSALDVAPPAPPPATNVEGPPPLFSAVGEIAAPPSSPSRPKKTPREFNGPYSRVPFSNDRRALSALVEVLDARLKEIENKIELEDSKGKQGLGYVNGGSSSTSGSVE